MLIKHTKCIPLKSVFDFNRYWKVAFEIGMSIWRFDEDDDWQKTRKWDIEYQFKKVKKSGNTLDVFKGRLTKTMKKLDGFADTLKYEILELQRNLNKSSDEPKFTNVVMKITTFVLDCFKNDCDSKIVPSHSIRTAFGGDADSVITMIEKGEKLAKMAFALIEFKNVFVDARIEIHNATKANKTQNYESSSNFMETLIKISDLITNLPDFTILKRSVRVFCKAVTIETNIDTTNLTLITDQMTDEGKYFIKHVSISTILWAGSGTTFLGGGAQ